MASGGSSESLGEWGRISQITPYLYLSGCLALTAERLRELGISVVVNATEETPRTPWPVDESIQIPIPDIPSAKLAPYFDAVADKIAIVKKRKGRVLVHCIAGVSRSASLCLAYLMREEGMTLDDAFRLLKAKRSIVRPNAGFWQQLQNYEMALKAKSARQ